MSTSASSGSGAWGRRASGAPDLAAFERERLALFSRHGFDGESRWVGDREGRRTYVIVGGDGPRPTILLHGGLSQAGEWVLLAGRIPGHLVVPDRPGCGLSYPVDYRGVDFRRAAADWLLDLVDGMGAERVDLVANSMGGFFAIAFALAHADRLRRLILVGAPAGLDARAPLFLRLWGNPLLGPIIAKRRITDPEVLRRRVFPKLVVHPETVPRELLEMSIAAAAIPGVDRASHTMLRSVLTVRGVRRQLMLRDDMARLDVPTLFAWGDADAFAPASIGRDLAARMPDARVELIADAGHVPYLDRPDAVSLAVAGFLAGSAPIGPPAATRAPGAAGAAE